MNSSNDIKENQQEVIINAIIDKSKESIKNIHSMLVTEPIKGKLPENIFRDYFLPHFSGQVPVSKDSNIITDWISIAGSPMSEVDILDPAGNVLYAVPALMNSGVIDLMNRSVGKSFNEINSQFELHNNNIPAVANTFLVRELDQKASELSKDTSHFNSSIERWKDIYKMYGLEDPLDMVVKNNEDNIDDDLIY